MKKYKYDFKNVQIKTMEFAQCILDRLTLLISPSAFLFWDIPVPSSVLFWR